jgi:tRNA (guanine10-N2)-methyltransferase
MDSELALILAGMAVAAPGKPAYDQFYGTGSVPIACSHFGAMTLGNDIEGRRIRGSAHMNIIHELQLVWLRVAMALWSHV